ncbi:uncharacterized protein LOC116973201 isoform X4 [Amblyraja radiata]|uniref:uncharacterized protein LOC116973201 isoform X4 n=1 Tax=Amblyraja radiata TaxID=386614 RepID=UPI0014042310|nr:uncharacterized protein LOC116973201 isoform X4 [Amblyraja radiata]
MEASGGGGSVPRVSHSPSRADFTVSPLAAQLCRKAVAAAAVVRTGPGPGARAGRAGGDVSAYSRSAAAGDSATFMDTVPVTVSLENVGGQHRIVCLATDANGGTLSYVGQLNSDVNLELQAAVSPQPLMQQDGLSAISAANPLLQIRPLDAGSQQLQNVCERQGEGRSGTKELDNDEPKKRKSGWPKGKKRKPPKDFAAPRAPTTGYVLFLNEQRSKLKIEHPELRFTEITKLLGTQWSQLSQEGKHYIDEAEKDKCRYIEELKAYQNSEAYQAFLKRRAINKVKKLCDVESLDTEYEGEAVTMSEICQDEGNNDLYCKTCNQYFSSLHNKKEHLFGRQHLQNLTGDFEKEAAELSKQQQQGYEDSVDDADMAESSHFCGRISRHNYTSLNLSFLEEFIFKQVKLREFELGELENSLEHVQDKHKKINKQLDGLKNQKLKLETDLANLKACGASLDAQLESLKMVPLLFQFHIQIMDNGNCIVQKHYHWIH